MSNNAALVWIIALTLLAIVLFAGSPDLHDALIEWFKK